MSTARQAMSKSERELAFLYDLYIAPDWGERFADLIDEHVTLPADEARALYVAAGTGGHALALRERGGEKLEVIGVDESEERAALARAKATAANVEEAVKFRDADFARLPFDDEEFDLVVGDASLVVAPERLPQVLGEMARVAAPGAIVAASVATSSSFGEFFSIYWEALYNAGKDEDAARIESLIQELPTVSDVEEMAADAGLKDVASWTNKEEFEFASGAAFLEAPLVSEFLLKRWLGVLPEIDDELDARVKGQIAAIIDEERAGANFVLSIKATLVSGRKSRVS